jgi:hypothetical protein
LPPVSVTKASVVGRAARAISDWSTPLAVSTFASRSPKRSSLSPVKKLTGVSSRASAIAVLKTDPPG